MRMSRWIMDADVSSSYCLDLPLVAPHGLWGIAYLGLGPVWAGPLAVASLAPTLGLPLGDILLEPNRTTQKKACLIQKHPWLIVIA
jgi:hypothetical protein